MFYKKNVRENFTSLSHSMIGTGSGELFIKRFFFHVTHVQIHMFTDVTIVRDFSGTLVFQGWETTR